MSRESREERLQRKLARLEAVLGDAGRPSRRDERPLRREHRQRGGGVAPLFGLALGFGVAAFFSGVGGLWIPAGILLGLALVGSLKLAGSALFEAARLEPDPDRAQVGLGATVASDAILEPGSLVEMGATVGSGAMVRSGAVVRMGATVKKRATVEAGAIIGWGATVGSDAQVGPDAVVGAGATVRSEAVVPAGMRLAPGTTWTRADGEKRGSGEGRRGNGAAPTIPARLAAAPAPPDPREARIAAACARIESELAQAPESVRDHLGGSARVAQSLRRTCDELIARERTLRAECSPEALELLAREQEELERRIAAAADERVRASLTSAVAAIAEQRRQRGLLQASAERVDAELTRLSWTLDGMAAQLVRLRTAGESAGAAPEAMTTAVEELHQEIDAISDALEEVSAPPRERQRAR